MVGPMTRVYCIYITTQFVFQDQIAQWLEHLVNIQEVLGSIPSLVMSFNKKAVRIDTESLSPIEIAEELSGLTCGIDSYKGEKSFGCCFVASPETLEVDLAVAAVSLQRVAMLVDKVATFPDAQTSMDMVTSGPVSAALAAILSSLDRSGLLRASLMDLNSACEPSVLRWTRDVLRKGGPTESLPAYLSSVPSQTGASTARTPG